jgi:hypothetical protein
MNIRNSSIFLILFLFCICSVTSFAESSKQYHNIDFEKAFPGFKRYDAKDAGVVLYYNPELCELQDKPHPEKDEYDSAGILIERPLRSQLLGKKGGYFIIDCDSGPSADPSCTIYKEHDNKLTKVFFGSGTYFIFPGNGIVFSGGHTNNMFDARQKYQWSGKEFEIVEQPFNYVGLDTVINTTINIYSSTNYSKSIAKLPKGSRILVLLNKNNDYLLKTPFGLLGWFRMAGYVTDQNTPIKGLYYAGD